MHWSQRNNYWPQKFIQDCLDSKLSTCSGSSSALCPRLGIPAWWCLVFYDSLPGSAWTITTQLNRSKTDYLWRHSSATQFLVKRCCVVQVITRPKLELVDRSIFLLLKTSRRHKKHASIVPREEEAREVHQKRTVWNKSERWDVIFFSVHLSRAL